jgi:hypothetical protein
MRLMIFFILLIPLAAPAPGQESRWLKGNTHTHSLWSDGNDFPEMIALWYREHGYDFLVLSDHNVLSQGQRWMNVRDINRRGGHEALDKYLARLGNEWVELRGEDPNQEVRLKNLDEVRKLVETDRFILIQGEEITDHFERRPVHTNAINLGELIEPQGGDSVREVMRRNLLAVREQAARLNRAILPHLNHPNFGYAITAEDIAHVLEEEFFEVYNGHPGVNHKGDEHHVSVERMWDIVSTIRLAELKAAPPYAVATDDSHQYHSGKQQTVTPGRGWIMVRCEALKAEPILHAMRRGDFYASSGVTLSELSFDQGRLTVAVKAEPGVKYTIEFIGTLSGFDPKVEPAQDAKGQPVTGRYSADVGKVLRSIEGMRATYSLSGEELYVRAVVRSDQPHPNPSFEGQVTEAWTQPVGWEKHLAAEGERP